MEFLMVLVSITVIILFIIMLRNIAKSKEYLHQLYLFEKVRMIEEGHLDPLSDSFTGWKFNPYDRPKKRDEPIVVTVGKSL